MGETTKQLLDEQYQKYLTKRNWLHEHEPELTNIIGDIADLAATFPNEENTSIKDKMILGEYTLNFDHIDVRIAGNSDVFTAMYKLLRKHGLKPSNRPGEDNFSEFSTYWRGDDGLKIWVDFTSMVCHREKIGTEFIERDVYETVCE